jgi:hypothetical protein
MASRGRITAIYRRLDNADGGWGGGPLGGNMEWTNDDFIFDAGGVLSVLSSRVSPLAALHQSGPLQAFPLPLDPGGAKEHCGTI